LVLIILRTIIKYAKRHLLKYAKTIEGNVIRGFFGVRTAIAVAA